MPHLQALWLKEQEARPGRTAGAASKTGSKGPTTADSRTISASSSTPNPEVIWPDASSPMYVPAPVAARGTAHCSMVPAQKKLGFTLVRAIYAAWVEELADNKDRTCILHGIYNGFHIVDPTATPTPAKTLNNHSTKPPIRTGNTANLLGTIEQGNYGVCQEKPVVISPFSVIPMQSPTVWLGSFMMAVNLPGLT